MAINVPSVNVTQVASKPVLTTVQQPTVAVPEKQPMSKGKKVGIAIASACITAAAIAGIAIAVKKGQAKKAAELVKQQSLNFTVHEKIADVASRTSEEGVAKRMADLAKAFGGEVEHVPQKLHATGLTVLTEEQRVAERMADLAKAFGAEVQHVAQDPMKWVK